ncbi:MAG: hypothetical protein IJJ23_12360 [Clostridia bacterium]|nr:hypothetical protein [Clostridia bacterium]
MEIRDLVSQEPELWPNEEYNAILREMKAYIDNKLYLLLTDSEHPYLHGFLFKSFLCDNPINASFGYPSFTLELQYLNKRLNLYFSDALVLEIKSNMNENNTPFMDELQKAYCILEHGFVEFIVSFSSGIKIYIRSLGLQIIEENNEA